MATAAQILTSPHMPEVVTSPLVERIRRGVIGEGELMDGPFGARRVTYADYTASGRSLDFIEDFIRDAVLPRYANTHTESSGTGLATTRLREEARRIIRDAVGGTADDLVIFCGSGATAAVNKLIGILELRIPAGLDERYGLAGRIPEAERPVVFVGGCSCAGPYGHRLLAIGPVRSHALRAEVGHGCDGVKPGWTRVNLNYFISEATAGYIAAAVELIAADGYRLLPDYRFDPRTGLWRHAAGPPKPQITLADVHYGPDGEMSYPRKRGQAGENAFPASTGGGAGQGRACVDHRSEGVVVVRGRLGCLPPAESDLRFWRRPACILTRRFRSALTRTRRFRRPPRHHRGRLGAVGGRLAHPRVRRRP
jgi:hypothetical protein